MEIYCHDRGCLYCKPKACFLCLMLCCLFSLQFCYASRYALKTFGAPAAWASHVDAPEVVALLSVYVALAHPYMVVLQ